MLSVSSKAGVQFCFLANSLEFYISFEGTAKPREERRCESASEDSLYALYLLKAENGPRMARR